MSRLRIPLFPLRTVLFPGGPLALRIFEPRYLDMVSDCLKRDSGFGVCLISEGNEVGEAADTYEVGTLGKISYWHRRTDGLLGITVTGEQRFRILTKEVAPNRLLTAEVELLPNEAPCLVPARCESLVTLLRSIMEQLDHPYITLPKHYDDAGWVGGRLVELLPMERDQKQYFLQLEDPLQRLEQLMAMLDEDINTGSK